MSFECNIDPKNINSVMDSITFDSKTIDQIHVDNIASKISKIYLNSAEQSF